jgi:Ca-activated chloride channel family protein
MQAAGINVPHWLIRTQRQMRSDPRCAIGHVLVAAAITAVVAAAPVQLQPYDQTVFRGRTDLVTVGVTVEGKKREFVTDLTAGDFAVYEDGRPQQILAFASGAQAGPPLHIGVLLDVSGSQELDLDFTQTAVIKFMRALPDAVDVTFIDFASHVRASRYTQSDFPRLVERVRSLTAGGETALYDAIGLYLADAAEQDGRKVMVVFTDGADNSSSLGLRELMTQLKTSDATVFTIGALDNQPQSTQSTLRTVLTNIARATGGMAFFPGRVTDLGRIYDQVLGEVRAQYTIGFVSSNDKTDGNWRSVEIKITRSDRKTLRVRARKGYYAPSMP